MAQKALLRHWEMALVALLNRHILLLMAMTGQALGTLSEGENLRVNGTMISQIKRILVYTFIYDGIANWQEANGIVTVKYPGAQDIIVRMDEYGTSQKMCAIALLENQNDQTFSVEKIIQFYPGHQQLDQAFHWGLKWVAGRK